MHTTNRYLELAPEMRALAREAGSRSVFVETEGNGRDYACDWMLITRNEAFLEVPDVRAHISEREMSPDARVPWSDDHCNLLRAMCLDD